MIGTNFSFFFPSLLGSLFSFVFPFFFKGVGYWLTHYLGSITIPIQDRSSFLFWIRTTPAMRTFRRLYRRVGADGREWSYLERDPSITSACPKEQRESKTTPPPPNHLWSPHNSSNWRPFEFQIIVRINKNRCRRSGCCFTPYMEQWATVTNKKKQKGRTSNAESENIKDYSKADASKLGVSIQDLPPEVHAYLFEFFGVRQILWPIPLVHPLPFHPLNI